MAQPTADEIRAMADLLHVSLEAGAVGLSTSFVDIDESYHPVPSRWADEAELDVSVSVSEFTGPGPLPPLTLHRVDYVQIAAPSDPGAILSGQIPDPLVPIALGTPVSVPAGQNQPLWFTARIPADAVAGAGVEVGEERGHQIGQPALEAANAPR